jgi:hypothetical protein
MTSTVFSEHGRKGLDLIKEMPWEKIEKLNRRKANKMLYTQKGVRQWTTRTILICEFSRHLEISSKSGGFEIELLLVLADDFNLLGENKHSTKKSIEAVASKETV